ncbi:hypothetical protein HYH02_014904 [Chlamydomonas schloesseri]|uniref:Uncharacterized protein n=1 Tax=Chlamydomonas schloesseri TaxID=2026947 RepID=A0A835SF96_9CHLO|nr:hypothetical protein HYH02_014904 [Chlamydomonas schloesseri]|eukprot:KAG2425904.1 hypothetical protein HYH02_014904 [Chlamydomonas schloesseri]
MNNRCDATLVELLVRVGGSFMLAALGSPHSEAHMRLLSLALESFDQRFSDKDAGAAHDRLRALALVRSGTLTVLARVLKYVTERSGAYQPTAAWHKLSREAVDFSFACSVFKFPAMAL